MEVGLKNQNESLSIIMPCGMHFGVKDIIGFFLVWTKFLR